MIKIEDIAYVRFGAPDLGRMRQFLLDFGMLDAEPSDDGLLRMRGYGADPYIHVTEQGEPGFRGVGVRAASLADLEKLAAAEGVSLEEVKAPGGGRKIRLVDPDGYEVDVIAGQQPAATVPAASRPAWNATSAHQRINAVKRVATGPAAVQRLGHLVLSTTGDLNKMWTWWRDRFGLLISDEVYAPDGSFIAAFVRCDRGDVPTDHHTFNFGVMPGMGVSYHHAAFEVTDFDDVMAGHDYLLSRGHTLAWGVGRHTLGSQVFDYWEDPWGNRVEHWSDGDLFTADVPVNKTDLATMVKFQWGSPPPSDFVTRKR